MRSPRGMLNGASSEDPPHLVRLGSAVRGGASLLVTVVLAFSWHLSFSWRDAAVYAARQRTAAGPLDPQEALASFELEPGYRIELAAAEPLVVDPVAMAFDERGRMYVVESRGYPNPVDPEEELPREGVIALLEDTNGDGRYNKRTNFAEGLTYPNGIMVWNGGVFASCAPDLLYLKDTNGDGRADIHKAVLTGFSVDKTAATRFSHPTLGMDNWVYLTHGLVGGSVTAPDYPERAAVEFTRSDSRFDPFTFDFELTGGQGQYGLTLDDFGRRFICDNRHPVWHVAMEPRYLRRNPHLPFSETVHEVSKVGTEAVVWPISADRTTASFLADLLSEPHAGTFTAASGVHIHRGDALPREHRGSIFICESAQNLVQRQVRSPDGVTFASRPAREGVEFLASRDSWFSPVFAANGPDGALYIVDMYRNFIDHPQFIPEPGRSELDFEAGKGYGRIYRIVAAEWKRESKPFDLAHASVEELCRALEHPNAWWRETAQRLLVERQDRAAVPYLRQVVTKRPSAVARVHALWTLEGLQRLETKEVVQGLQDQDAGVRENAVRLAESRLGRSTELLSHLLTLAEDSDDGVRFRVALALGETEDPRATEVLADLARRDGDHLWARMAVLSSIGNRASEFLRAFAASPPASPAITAAVMQDLGQIFGAGQSPERCVDLILHITDPANDFVWQPAAVAGVAEGLRTRGLGQGNRSPLTTLVSGSTPKAREARARIEAVLQRAATVALDERQPPELRLATIELLGYGAYASDGKTLERLLEPQHPPEIQMAAVRSLGRLNDSAAGRALVEPSRWRTYTPQVRETVLSVLMAETNHLPALLGAIEQGDVAPTALGRLRRTQLVKHRDASIQQRAIKVFANTESGDRMQVYQQYKEKITDLAGHASKGEQVFATRCAACHTFDGTGRGLAPDLSGIGNQPREAILLHTLVPDYEITPGYDAYTLETQDGRALLGLLESETETSITLRDPTDRQETIPRRNIVSMSASGNSLMPSGLEELMTEQELADLIAFLKRRTRGGDTHR
ncbi:MAG: c-type cytochrome [Luteitalea sp.]|nr:c-type cytochrome [Luteitalea sp.]